jgi:hypothetical protein
MQKQHVNLRYAIESEILSSWYVHPHHCKTLSWTLLIQSKDSEEGGGRRKEIQFRETASSEGRGAFLPIFYWGKKTRGREMMRREFGQRSLGRA